MIYTKLGKIFKLSKMPMKDAEGAEKLCKMDLLKLVTVEWSYSWCGWSADQGSVPLC